MVFTNDTILRIYVENISASSELILIQLYVISLFKFDQLSA